MSRLAQILALVCALGGTAFAQPRWRLAGTATAGSGVDTNPRRTLGEMVGPFEQSDGFLSLIATGRARLAFDDSHALSANLELGGRKYLRVAGEDVIAADGTAGYTFQRGRWLLGANGGGKIRRSRIGDRDYTDLAADAWADWLSTDALSLRLTAGIRGFQFPDNPLQDSVGPQFALSGRYRLSRQHALAATVGGSPRFFDGTRRLHDGTFDPSMPRRDRQLWAQLSYGYRGGSAVQAGLGWVQQASNSFGESTDRYRLSVAISRKLPFDLYAMVQGTLQLIRYPDGIFLARELLLQDDEAQSSLAAKLAWPIDDHFDLEARYGLYYIRLPDEAIQDPALSYLRQTLQLGLAARW